MAECKHEIEEATCSVCTPRHATRGPQTRSSPFGPWFTASYDSRDGCAGCGGDITAGHQIRSDGCGNWLCASCGSAGPVDDGLGAFGW